MNWMNFFRMYAHAYEPYEMDGHTVYHLKLMYPIQGLLFDIHNFGWNTAWYNFKVIMAKDEQNPRF